MTLEDRIRWSNIYLIVFTEENKEKNKEEGVFIESDLASAVREAPGFPGSALLKILKSRACPGCCR